MKRWYVAVALAAIIGMVVLVEAGVNGMDIGGNGMDTGSNSHDNGINGGIAKWRHMMGRMAEYRHREKGGMHQEWQHMARHILNITRLEGVLENINGSYYVDDIPLYFGDEMFLNTLARSDYDGDGNYEQVWQELQGLEGTHVVINGVMNNATLYVSHINGIWLRIPGEMNFMQINGTLENINGTFYVGGYELRIKRGYSRSDIDGDGLLERMYQEFAGLEGTNVTVDGIANDGCIMVMHINGIWAR